MRHFSAPINQSREQPSKIWFLMMIHRLLVFMFFTIWPSYIHLNLSRLLTDSDNYTTRDFTIYIANKKWVKTTLVPLMELGVGDRDLTMRCCRLLMVLTRNLNYDAKSFSLLEVKKIKGKETKEEGAARFRRETESKLNAQQQISAFLSFKDAICTGKPPFFLYLSFLCSFILNSHVFVAAVLLISHIMLSLLLLLWST